jgi:sensor domain CHASE-containing protein
MRGQFLKITSRLPASALFQILIVVVVVVVVVVHVDEVRLCL